MAEAVINKAYTFQALYLDDASQPMVVGDPRITIFSFSQSGVKQVVIDNQPMLDAVPAEVGRYTYTLVIPGAYTDGDTLHAEMEGLDVGQGNARVVVAESVSVISIERGQGSSGGLRPAFVR